MAKMSKATVDSNLRTDLFENYLDMERFPVFQKINDRTYGGLFQDVNGSWRYVRLNLVVAEEREEMTAEELMNSEIAAYQAKQQAKADRKAEREAKAKRDAEKRAKIAAEKAAKAAEVAASK